MRVEIYILVGVAMLIGGIAWFVRHQRSLKVRAHLMEEAIRNRDFTFRLSTSGLLPGERAMQNTLNRLGDTIRQQIRQNEVEAWERLTRVLTHEIMNATAPITSISQAMLGRPDVKGTPLEEGIHAIFSTSQHLNVFIDSYRKLSQLQKPSLKDVSLASLVKDIRQLFQGIAYECNVNGALQVCADPNMLRQILINLTKNAIEAGATIVSFAVPDDDSQQQPATLYVSNNGQPIPAEARKSIFVPFFTTKRTGNGIGLSLSRQMMVLQGGSLELAEKPLTPFRTTFVISFKA